MPKPSFFCQGPWSYPTVGEGFHHLTVNNNLHFVDLVMKATMNHIKRMWKEAKQERMQNQLTAFRYISN